MNKICTSIEQSQKLIELGIDINTADMCWSIFKTSWGERIYTIIAYPMLPNQGKGTEKLEYIPTWSLTALLELIMPKGTTPVYVDNIYQMVYDIKPYYITSKFDNPLDAAFEMIVWLKENGKI